MLSVAVLNHGGNSYCCFSIDCPDENQVDVINGLSEEDGVAHYLNSSLNKSAIEKVKSDILSGKTKLLYVAPESLTKEDNVDFLKDVKISFYAIDEAHCISEWGMISVRSTVVSAPLSTKSVMRPS